MSDLKQKGEGAKGNKYAWAIKLKMIEAIITEQRQREKTTKRFSRCLNLGTQQDQEKVEIFSCGCVYKEKEGAKPQDIPDLSSGTLPAALKEADKPGDWVRCKKSSSSA